jgi:hypothetical protein
MRGGGYMKKNTAGSLAVTFGAALLLVAMPALAGKPTKPGGGGGGDPCIGAAPSFVFTKAANTGGRRDFYLANASATCQRFLFSLSAGNFERYSSFRVVSGQGRIVTTDGASDLLLARFPIGIDMQVDTASIVIDRIFDPAQAGTIDVTNFDLAADGQKLAYVTSNEDGGSTSLWRLRVINSVDACVTASCSYDAGEKLAERIGSTYGMLSPRWNASGTMIYVEDYYGVWDSPYISRIPTSTPHTPEIVIDGSKLRLFELRSRSNGSELLAYGEQAGSGCRDVRVVDVSSAGCGNASCPRVNSESPRVLVIRFATLESVSDTAMTILADGATEGRKSGCSGTGTITKAVDSAAGIQISTLTSGASPASR